MSIIKLLREFPRMHCKYNDVWIRVAPKLSGYELLHQQYDSGSYNQSVDLDRAMKSLWKEL